MSRCGAGPSSTENDEPPEFGSAWRASDRMPRLSCLTSLRTSRGTVFVARLCRAVHGSWAGVREGAGTGPGRRGDKLRPRSHARGAHAARSGPAAREPPHPRPVRRCPPAGAGRAWRSDRRGPPRPALQTPCPPGKSGWCCRTQTPATKSPAPPSLGQPVEEGVARPSMHGAGRAPLQPGSILAHEVLSGGEPWHRDVLPPCLHPPHLGVKCQVEITILGLKHSTEVAQLVAVRAGAEQGQHQEQGPPAGRLAGCHDRQNTP